MALAAPTVIGPGENNPHLRETYTLRAPPADAIEITDDVGPLATLRSFDIRNGPISAARSLLVKPTIGVAWHWRPIAELPPNMAIRHVNAFIRTYCVALMDLAVERYPNALKRKLAIVMGVARAVTTELYNIEAQDLIPGETGGSYLTATMTPEGGIRFTPAADLTDNQRATLTQAIEFTETEKAAISSIHMTAIGVLPLQGLSLTMCNHHYLSDAATQSFKAFSVVEKQFWVSESVKTWWEEDKVALRDALFHKVGHPVLINVKQTIAMNPETAQKLKIAGCGAAASRLPAVEAEIKTAKSYKVLLQTVRVLFQMYNGYLNFVVLDEALEVAERCPPGVLNYVAEGALPQTVAPYVKDRASALRYLSQVTNNHTDIVAYCYGFYVALSDANQAASGTVEDDTLKTSYSLAKLARQSTAAYTAGKEAYGDYAAYKRAKRANAEYSPPAFVFRGGRELPEGMVPAGVGVQELKQQYVDE